jgi:hypothetical protein
MRERPDGIQKCVLYGITCIIIMGQTRLFNRGW